VTSATEIVSPYEQRFEIRDGLLVKGQMRSSPLNASSGPRLAGESENATIVRRFVDAFNRADFDAALRDVDPDIELDEWPVAPGAQSYRGHEGVRRALDTWFESWEWMRVEVEGIVEVDDRLLLTLHQRARGRESAVEVEIQTFNVYTFRDRRIVRMQLFTERAPALEAAGMAHPEGSGAR
jgi:ketosteroid isomerase-like protein